MNAVLSTDAHQTHAIEWPCPALFSVPVLSMAPKNTTSALRLG